MKLMRILFFLLALSLILQNTCPYGFAAKTAFAAQHSQRCPFHHHQTNGQGTVDDNSGKAVYPAFVMVTPFVQPSVVHFPLSADYLLFSSGRYVNPFKEPLIKPPVA
jgi:hypothetical protein